MTKTSRSIMAVVVGAVAAAAFAPAALVRATPAAPAVDQDRGGRRAPAQPAQKAKPAPPPRPAQPARPPRPSGQRPARNSQVVFIGGYFYDPFFGPYPWWRRPAYPGWYFPYFDDRAEVKIDCHQHDAAVYVDGFYAGVVDDFDGLFQGLPLPPGGHRVSLYLEGYVTADFSVYLRRGSTFTIHHEMAPLHPGERSRPPQVAPAVPPPPDGTYTPPRGTPPVAPSTPSATPNDVEVGTIEVRVQPATAVVRIDGEAWLSSEAGRYEIQLPAGAHRVEVSATGYRSFSSDVTVRDGEVDVLNVSLVRAQ